MLQVKVKVGIIGQELEWEEFLDVTCEESGGTELLQALERFNEEETRFSTPRFRELRSVIGIARSFDLHDWSKQNLVTLPDMTDLWRCRRCGLQMKTVMRRPDPKHMGGCRKRG